MNENAPVALPTARQFDHLVFELLDPIHRLDDGSRQRLLVTARHLRLGPGERLDAGTTRGLMLYLVQGQVERWPPLGLPERIDERHRNSAEPLIPEGLSEEEQAETLLVSCGESELIGFDRALYKHLLETSSHTIEGDELVLQGPEQTLFKRLMDDLHHDRLQVPHLPELAKPLRARLRRSAAAPHDDGTGLARLIEGAPALAIEVTRTAGTPSIAEALLRLGPRRARGIAIGASERLAARTFSPLVRERLARAHRHSVDVAAFSHVIAARHGGLDPEKALLCGLLHDVGTFAVLALAEDMMERFGSGLALDAATRRLHGVIGSLMLGRLGYDHDVVMCAEGADDWRRNPGPTIDYADVVLVAQLHSFIGSSRAHWMPQFATVPAFLKLTGGEPSPALSRSLLSEGRRRIQERASLLDPRPPTV